MRLELGDHAIRPYGPGDVDALVRHADDPAVARHLRDRFPSPYRRGDALRWIEDCRTQRPCTNFAIADAREAIGGIGLVLGEDVFRRSAEVGYWLGRAQWGKGIATAALRAFTDWSFASFDLCRIWAAVFEDNPASKRVLVKAGYEREARLRKSVTKAGRTMDQILYAIVRE